MHQGTCGDFLSYQQTPGIKSDTMRLHKTRCREVIVPRFYKIVAGFPALRSDSEHGMNTARINVEVMLIRIENYSFGFDLRIGDLVKGGLLVLLEDHLISETCDLEESASHHRRNITFQQQCW